MRRRLVLLPLALVVGACGTDAEDSEECAPAGTYALSYERSADPGDCPLICPDACGAAIACLGDECHSREWGTLDDLEVGDDELCGNVGTESFDGGSSASGCSYVGRASADASSTGLNGTLTTTFTCPSGSCTANFDLVYTKL